MRKRCSLRSHVFTDQIVGCLFFEILARVLRVCDAIVELLKAHLPSHSWDPIEAFAEQLSKLFGANRTRIKTIC